MNTPAPIGGSGLSMDEHFTCQCISDMLDGLSDGLSHFSGPSRAALIYAVEPDDPVRIYDPQNLLRGHEPKFEELYLNSDQWRQVSAGSRDRRKYGDVLRERDLQLAGLISHGGRSGSVFYQMWFAEHHPDMCSTLPTERWLEFATYRVSHDLANEKDLYTGISGSYLKEYATHAVRDTIVDEMNVILGMDTQLRIFPLLDAVLEISRTREEGQWPRGQLAFVEPGAVEQLSFVARFPEMERPAMDNRNHIRKLLQSVEGSDRKLVSDGRTVVGIAENSLQTFALTADFRGGHGFLLLPSGPICSFSDGSFKSTTRKAKLVQVEEVLLEADLDPEEGNTLFKILADIVHSAESAKHGCTLVVDLNRELAAISGQRLETPLDLRQTGFLDLAKSLSKVDGALHIGADMHLHGFACLLDGRAIAGEDRARGARYNSALRYSAEHENVMVVVVSADRPVSVIQDGVELSAQCQWKPVSGCLIRPPTLAEWIAEADG